MTQTNTTICLQLMPEDSLASAMAKLRTGLESAGIATASLDARMLMRKATGFDDVTIITQGTLSLAEKAANLNELYDRRLNHEPIAYITGEREFYGRMFGVNHHTLIPRPDSETLIDATLALLPNRDMPMHIMDIGTGSGCLLLTLLAEYPHADGVGLDVSAGAIAMARRNAKALGLVKRSRFLHADMAYCNWHKAVDLLISNPPYVAALDAATLTPDVRDYEPSRALFAGNDGLAAYHLLAERAPLWLAPTGKIILEIGQHQSDAVIQIMQKAGFIHMATRSDLASIPRALIFQPSHHHKG